MSGHAGTHLQYQGWEGRNGVLQGAGWAVSLAKSASSRFIEISGFKN